MNDEPAGSAAKVAALEAAGVRTLIGTVVNAAGLTQVKVVSLDRVAVFADHGLGTSPTWHVFAIDQAGIVVSDEIGVVGDRRVCADLAGVALLGDGVAWAPCSFFTQDGNPDPHCGRGVLQRVTQRLAAAGLTAVVGHEVEFVLVGPDGARLPSDLWAQYGLAGVLEFEGFVRDVMEASAAAGVSIEQFHPEYGANQFEFSLMPRDPVTAADQLVLARIIISRVARRHGLRVSLSPVPFAGSVGSGAHQHFSLSRDGAPVFSGGLGERGMTEAGASAIAGLLAGLPGAQGVLCGSIVSGLRIQPGSWSGANVCWGTENREAAVRFVSAASGNPYGANVEVKIVDPSANPYLASATILGLALDGISRELSLPPEVTVDPVSLTLAQREHAGVVTLPSKQAEVLDALRHSAVVRDILGDAPVDAVLGVRGYEQQNYGGLSDTELAEKFRLAWSV
ncbi:glutamine synthetase family protein [Mycobacterium sp. SMC-16]|uniref:glutamine synthetase family protein n=1 Tax=Mycobacteriaceae TaxID=1762 RepID=UPI00076A8239|nr:glutamine synthetase family protein [Mycolicibacterium mucogenicum]MCX8557324.1 glutamine synthetase family protein [Mycolicibacterium mucogenicum]